MKQTIKDIDHQIREWNGPKGMMKFVQGHFSDGSRWSVGCKPENAEARHKELTLLIGKEGEFSLEDRGERNGIKEWKLLEWPGKAQSGGRGGGGGGLVRYRDTEQGTKEERLSIARSVALQQAVVYVSQHGSQESIQAVLDAADQFYGWLAKTQPALGQIEEQMQQADQGPAQPPASAPKSSTFRRPPCPSCGKTESVFQQKDRNTKEFITGSYYCWKKKDGCGHEWRDVGEMAAQLGVDSPLATKSLTELIDESIDRAVSAKNQDLLAKIQARIVERVLEGAVSPEDAAVFEQRIGRAREMIASGKTVEDWYAAKVREAQGRLHHEQAAEMAHPSENDNPF